MKIQIKLLLTAFLFLISSEIKPAVTISNVTPYWLKVAPIGTSSYQYLSPSTQTVTGYQSYATLNSSPITGVYFWHASDQPSLATKTVSDQTWQQLELNSSHNTWVIYYSPLDGTFRVDYYN